MGNMKIVGLLWKYFQHAYSSIASNPNAPRPSLSLFGSIAVVLATRMPPILFLYRRTLPNRMYIFRVDHGCDGNENATNLVFVQKDSIQPHADFSSLSRLCWQRECHQSCFCTEGFTQS